MAKILAKALDCTGPDAEHVVSGPTVTPCGMQSCRAIAASTALDVIEMDAASNRGMDDIRELRNKVGYTPVNGRYKVYVIDEVHTLTKEAFNALLKTLEEPPPHVVFVLATTEVHRIPATLSRCKRSTFASRGCTTSPSCSARSRRASRSRSTSPPCWRSPATPRAAFATPSARSRSWRALRRDRHQLARSARRARRDRLGAAVRDHRHRHRARPGGRSAVRAAPGRARHELPAVHPRPAAPGAADFLVQCWDDVSDDPPACSRWRRTSRSTSSSSTAWPAGPPALGPRAAAPDRAAGPRPDRDPRQARPWPAARDGAGPCGSPRSRPLTRRARGTPAAAGVGRRAVAPISTAGARSAAAPRRLVGPGGRGRRAAAGTRASRRASAAAEAAVQSAAASPALPLPTMTRRRRAPPPTRRAAPLPATATSPRAEPPASSAPGSSSSSGRSPERRPVRRHQGRPRARRRRAARSGPALEPHARQGLDPRQPRAAHGDHRAHHRRRPRPAVRARAGPGRTGHARRSPTPASPSPSASPSPNASSAPASYPTTTDLPEGDARP